MTELTTRFNPEHYQDLARRRWPEAERVEGGGPYAMVVRLNGRTLAVLLWFFADDALDAYLEMAGSSAVTLNDLRAG